MVLFILLKNLEKCLVQNKYIQEKSFNVKSY